MKDGNLTKASMAMAVADPAGAPQKDADGSWIVSMKDGKPEPFILSYTDDKTKASLAIDKPVEPFDSR